MRSRREYTDITNEHWIVDIGAAKLADTPEAFDVVVMPNLYGDVLSDVAAQIAGSVGLAGSANIGANYAMFEAIHGSAPRRAGQNLANPSGLLLGAVMMLVHIDQTDVAERVHNAWLRTLEDGIHTYDIYTEGVSKQKVGTKEFAQAVVARVGQKPEKLKPSRTSRRRSSSGRRHETRRTRLGAEGTGRRRRLRRLDGAAAADDLGSAMEKVAGDRLEARHDRQPRHEGLARRLPGNVHRRHLALPLHGRRGGSGCSTRRSSTCSAASRAPASTSSRSKACTISTARPDTRSVKASKVNDKPLVAVIMGSKSDWETMRHADEMLTQLRRAARMRDRLGASHASA